MGTRNDFFLSNCVIYARALNSSLFCFPHFVHNLKQVARQRQTYAQRIQLLAYAAVAPLRAGLSPSSCECPSPPLSRAFPFPPLPAAMATMAMRSKGRNDTLIKLTGRQYFFSCSKLADDPEK